MKELLKCIIVSLLIFNVSLLYAEQLNKDESLSMKAGVYLRKIGVNSKTISGKKYTTIWVADINVSKIKDKKNVTAEECKKQLLNDIMLETKDIKQTSFVFGDTPDHSSAKLIIDITEMNPGDTAQRFLAGEIGLGSAVVRIDGRLIDIDTGVTLIQFSDKRGATGAWKLRNTFTDDSGPGLIKDIIYSQAQAVVKELDRVLNETGSNG